jgi:hypothetical protein
MTFLQVLVPLLKSGAWLAPKLFESEREKRGPSFWKRMKLLYTSKRQLASTHVRVSMVKGRRINQYQPVGGVYKHDSQAVRDQFTKWDVREDEIMPIDIHSRDDLRVRVLGKNLIPFLNWFVSEKDRETTQQREFQEELVEPGYLSKAFATIDPRYLYTVWRPLTYSPHTQATELMVYQVFELKLTAAQEHELRHLQLPASGELRWVTEEQIKRLGDDQFKHLDPFRIGQHACYLLSSEG